MISEDIKKNILLFQANEITEHIVYKKLAEKSKGNNTKILKRISDDELKHYNEWKKYTKEDIDPNQLKILKYLILAVLFGLSFTMKIMEKGEEKAQVTYENISVAVPKANKIFQDEQKHEALLIDMIDEKRLDYISLMIQGLNDALIELFGELAGFSFALQNPTLIGFAGLISGIANFLSSSASEIELYLSKKSEENKETLKTSLYEGTIYLFTIFFLITPFFLLTNYYNALLITTVTSFFIIILFTFYVSVVREVSLKKMFSTMFVVTAGIASLSFAIGWIAKTVLNL
jgi:VIT1/CCC1 family predicted Fe2+/Mn2+ transporter